MADNVAHYMDENELFLKVNKSPIKYNKRKIKRAFEFANEAHGDQRRVSGIPYILHPTSVACILVDMGMDSDAICAGLLHDTVEDTDVTLKNISDEFGDDVAVMVDGLTKISKIQYTDREEQQAENVRKMLMFMSNDIRVIIIKLADRLHNMRTIECIPEQKRRDKSLECMEVYAPIAHRLGMKAVKEELEDLSLRYLDPVGVEEIEKELALSKEERDEFIEEIKRKIMSKIGRSISHVQISGRVKSITSIYRKTYMQAKKLSEIFDIFAVRVLVDTISDCYTVLGIVHDVFQPLPARFKDYISTPKSNMYQSLHTTVFDKNSIPFEIQIRTYEMHETAEFGIAAHWKYKAKIKSGKNDINDDRLEWIRKMLEIQSEAEDATDIVKSIKNELDEREVYVFSPKGDVFPLPYKSTIVDMAYAIHSEVGNKMVGAKANFKIVPISYQLKTGDIIEIITRKDAPGPTRDWLNLAKSSEARSKIKTWFKKEKREENIIEGKEDFYLECKKYSCVFKEEDIPECMQPILKKQHVNSLDDFYAAVGYGGIKLWKLMPRIKDIYDKKYQKEDAETPTNLVYKHKEKVGSGVNVEGQDDVLIKFSKCCNPLPGDDIIGYITRGFGVSIHKRDCTNVPEDLAECEEPERWVKASWDENIRETFKSTLEITSIDRPGFLADLTHQLSLQHINIHALNSRTIDNDTVILTVTIEISNMNHLNSVIAHLSKVKGVTSITRI